MNTYIQNKLDEFDNNKFFKILNIPVDNVYAEKDGLRFDLQEINIKEIIEQSLTDYHNHIVEKIESIKREKNPPLIFSKNNEIKEFVPDFEFDSTILYKQENQYNKELEDILSLLQDTNPKEL